MKMELEVLFPVDVVNDKKIAVDGRSLMKWLGKPEKNFVRDIDMAIEKAQLVENQDYEVLLRSEEPDFKGVRAKDYVFHPDAAKDIAMMSSSDKGKQVRDYFKNCEKMLTKISQLTEVEILEQLAKLRENRIKEQTLLIEEQKRSKAGVKSHDTRKRRQLDDVKEFLEVENDRDVKYVTYQNMFVGDYQVQAPFIVEYIKSNHIKYRNTDKTLRNLALPRFVWLKIETLWNRTNNK